MDDERDSDRSADVGHSEEEEESSGGEDGEDSKTESKGAAKRSLKKEKSPRKSDACDYKSDKNVKVFFFKIYFKMSEFAHRLPLKI